MNKFFILTAFIIFTFSVQGGDVQFDKKKILTELEKISKNDIVPGYIHIKYKSSKDIKAAKRFLQRTDLLDAEIIERPFFHNSNSSFKISPELNKVFRIKFSDKKDAVEICKNLMYSGEIEFAYPMIKREFAEYETNDPMVDEQYYIKLTQLDKAWKISKGDSSITIAIIDSGVDTEHEDLKDNIYTNYAEIPGDGIDNDNNGKIDDIRGWDFIGNTGEDDLAFGNWQEDNNVIPDSVDNNHGTHVAGTAGAVTNNGTGISGAAFNCRLLPIKCTTDDLDVSGGVYRTNDALQYAASMGADIINCSWLSRTYDPVEEMIIRAYLESGGIVVAAAGNDGNMLDDNIFPAAHKGVISVGASNQLDDPGNTSNYGPAVSVFAPGNNIYSTYSRSRYGKKDGTSMATPIVTGIAALLKSKHPDWNHRKIETQLKLTSDKIFEGKYAYTGRINAYNALSNDNNPFYVFDSLSINGRDYIYRLHSIDIVLYISDLNGSSPANAELELSSDDIFVKQKDHDLSKHDSTNFMINSWIDIDQSFPWFYSVADLYAKFIIDTNYYYTRIKVPVEIEDYPESRIIKVPQKQGITFIDTDAYGDDGFIAAGNDESGENGRIYIHAEDSLKHILNVDSEVKCVHAAGNDIYFAGVSAGSPSINILKIENGVITENVSLSENNGYIADIHFYDDKTGIAICSNKDNRFLIYRTNDGGKTFNKVEDTPQILVDFEKFLHDALHVSDSVTFGVSIRGRIIKSEDKGKSWKTILFLPGNIVINDVVFKKSNEAVVFYRIVHEEQLKAAYSTGDWNSWQKINATNDHLQYKTVNYFFSPDSSDEIIASLKNNKLLSSFDNGKSWKDRRSRDLFGEKVVNGTAITAGNTMILRNIYDDIVEMKFDVIPRKRKIGISYEPENVVDFDTLKVGETVTRSIDFINKGNIRLRTNIYQMTFLDVDGLNSKCSLTYKEYPALRSVPPYGTRSITFECTGKELGYFEKYFRINFDYTGEKEFYLKAVVDEGSGVKTEYSNEDITLYPNPTDGYFQLETDQTITGKVRLIIFDNSGKKIFEKNYTDFISPQSVEIPLNKLESGSYSLVVSTKNSVLKKKFILIE